MPNDVSPPLHLRRIERSLNMRRFYTLTLQPTLFGEMSLTRHWGRIGTQGRSMTETFADECAARHALERLTRIKRGRGYIDTV
ncbi:WGR domain-containing protein [Rhizobiaceae bacterium BDR2-2]|uniref:WGR domain-containing protein n=1 Tax=Ectorhizobium quercum TaxID=2965071 RepID=A0AAE3SUZ7_9HYPH|nr:WGR domain-containing protein [Ectorhizobium quercum]MCX8997223.1 WGR domain-containing protein [Ectorhizobium quercum]